VDLSAYGLVVQRVSRVPGGFTAECYRVAAGAGDYLVKVWARASAERARTLELLEVLASAGLPVAPPLRTLGGEVSTVAGAAELAVFPYVGGVAPPGWPGWPDDVLRRLGGVLARIHRVDVSLVASLHRDSLEVLTAYPSLDGIAAFRGFADEVGAQLRRLAGIRTGSFRPVLCHADVKGDNLLLTGDVGIVLDWDGAVIGPAENDLTLVVTPDPRPLSAVLAGYRAAGGDVAGLSLRRLEFCMLRRYLGDAAARVERIAAPETTDGARTAAVADFETWGVRMWRRLDACLAAAAPQLAPGPAAG
jgi:Ser/Thr protein kinase RdoA (MazF antagonist)